MKPAFRFLGFLFGWASVVAGAIWIMSWQPTRLNRVSVADDGTIVTGLTVNRLPWIGGGLQVWSPDLKKRRTIRIFESIGHFTVVPDGRSIIALTSDGTWGGPAEAHRIDLGSGIVTKRYRFGDQHVSQISSTADPFSVVISMSGKRVVLNLATDAATRIFPSALSLGGLDSSRSFFWNWDGPKNTLITSPVRGSRKLNVRRLWGVPDQNLACCVPANKIAFITDGQLHVRKFDDTRGTRQMVIPLPTDDQPGIDSLGTVVFNRAGDRLLTYWERTLCIIDANTGKILHQHQRRGPAKSLSVDFVADDRVVLRDSAERSRNATLSVIDFSNQVITSTTVGTVNRGGRDLAALALAVATLAWLLWVTHDGRLHPSRWRPPIDVAAFMTASLTVLCAVEYGNRDAINHALIVLTYLIACCLLTQWLVFNRWSLGVRLIVVFTAFTFGMGILLPTYITSRNEFFLLTAVALAASILFNAFANWMGYRLSRTRSAALDNKAMDEHENKRARAFSIAELLWLSVAVAVCFLAYQSTQYRPFPINSFLTPPIGSGSPLPIVLLSAMLPCTAIAYATLVPRSGLRFLLHWLAAVGLSVATTAFLMGQLTTQFAIPHAMLLVFLVTTATLIQRYQGLRLIR